MKTPQSKSYQPAKDSGKKVVPGQAFQDRNLAALKDGGESLAPTDAQPVSLHKRMAGAC